MNCYRWDILLGRSTSGTFLPLLSLGECLQRDRLSFPLSLWKACSSPILTCSLPYFRGAGESDGRTSWTARPELGDYISFYGFMVHYIHGLEPELTRNSAEFDSSNATSESRDCASRDGG